MQDPSCHPVERAIDAAANRAREGLRVIEDFARFVAPDESVARKARDLRHLVTSLVERLGPYEQLLAERAVELDVGASPKAFATRNRSSPNDVLCSAFKRSEEALRSLAEFSRLIDPAVADSFEQARYDLYSLEKRTCLARAAARKLAGARLLTTVLASEGADPDAAAALQAGADAIELRRANAYSPADREFLEIARRLRSACSQRGALLLVRGRPDISRLAGADGVILEEGGLSAADSRRIAGPAAIVCREICTGEEASASALEGADCLIVPSKYAAPPGFPVFVRCESPVQAEAILASGACKIAVSATAGPEELRRIRALLDQPPPKEGTAPG